MRSSRWVHVAALIAVGMGIAGAQVGSNAPTGTGGTGAGSQAGSQGSATTVTPAGRSPVESSDVPPWRPSPARFAVAPFENQAPGVRSFDWLVAAAPFEISQKTEDVFGLESTGGPLHVGAAAVVPEPDPVAAFAAQRQATWVITGWVDRPKWQLRIGLTLWKVEKGQAVVVAEEQRMGELKTYHQLLGEALADMWHKGASFPVDVARRTRLSRAIASDLYAVHLMGRGLGHLIGALGAVNLKLAERDLEHAVFVDPKCFECQRVLGELYLAESQDPKLAALDPKLAQKAFGKFAYANDLAPDDIWSLRAAATGASRAGKHEIARDLLKRLVTRKPWNLDARYELGVALWQTGDAAAAQRQLEQVTQKKPDHLPARRVLVLIHASRSDTSRLVSELEAIAARAPMDLDVKLDLATAYGALGQWDKAFDALEYVAVARPGDLPLIVRVGDAKRRMRDVDGALAWYGKAQKLDPSSSYPGYSAAQALYDAGKLAEASRAYTSLQRFKDDLPAAEHALGAIAYQQGRFDDAAWYLRRSVRSMPRNIIGWRALIAAELGRKDTVSALAQLERGLAFWPRDATLQYLSGVAHALAGDRGAAREHLGRALAAQSNFPAARAALGALDAGGTIALAFMPELIRPWGDTAAMEDVLARYAQIATDMVAVRASFQHQFLSLLAAIGKGPYAAAKQPPVRTCPVGRVAPAWSVAQQELRKYERLGSELEATYRFVWRHDELGATAALLPNARSQVIQLRKGFKIALADVSELRAQWARTLVPELRNVGCTDKLLAAAVADPERYRVIQEDKPPAIPETKPPRPKPRATFYVDNTRCRDAVDVWIDGVPLGQVAAGKRSALVSEGGERTLCLIVPGAAQCGDRGTVRQVYLHDGWTTTMYCLK